MEFHNTLMPLPPVTVRDVSENPLKKNFLLTEINTTINVAEKRIQNFQNQKNNIQQQMKDLIRSNPENIFSDTMNCLADGDIQSDYQISRLEFIIGELHELRIKVLEA